MGILYDRLLILLNESSSDSTFYHIALAMLQHMELLHSLAINEVADLCSVSKSTISKFMGYFFVRGDQHGLCLCGVEDPLIIEILNGVVPVQVLARLAEHDQQGVLVRTGNIVHLLDIVPGCHNELAAAAQLDLQIDGCGTGEHHAQRKHLFIVDQIVQIGRAHV